MILLLADQEPDWSYNYQQGRIWKGGFYENDRMYWTDDVMIVCREQDVICCWRGAAENIDVMSPFQFLADCGILEQYLNPRDWKEILLRAEIFRAIDQYDHFDGFGGMSLNEYMGRLYRRDGY